MGSYAHSLAEGFELSKAHVLSDVPLMIRLDMECHTHKAVVAHHLSKHATRFDVNQEQTIFDLAVINAVAQVIDKNFFDFDFSITDFQSKGVILILYVELLNPRFLRDLAMFVCAHPNRKIVFTTEKPIHKLPQHLFRSAFFNIGDMDLIDLTVMS